MSTDIVGSTERAAVLGDRAWRDLLARHHALVRRELGRYRGKERDSTGDGFFATFDGPARAIRAGQAQTVRDLVAGSGIAFHDRGSHELKGIPGTWQLFAATSG